MADELPPPEESTGAAADPEASAPGRDEEPDLPGKQPHRGPWLAVLAFIVLVVALEVAGLLLRDPLERRLPRLTEAPAVVGEVEGGTASTSTPGARFGPDVREVAVAAADTRPPPGPESPAETSAAPDPAPPEIAVAEIPAPVPVTTPTGAVSRPTTPTDAAPTPSPGAPAAAPVATGSHALQVGIFGSQKYRHAMERQLEEAGLPHLRRQRSKPGEGYRLALTLADAEQSKKAQATLDAAGILYNLQGNSLEALFHFEAEAQRALQKLSDAGLNGGYAKTRGELPLWVVYAGPFALEEAKRVRQQLAILGLPSYLRNAP